MPKGRKKKAEIKDYVPSKYQKAIFDFIKSGYGNLVVEASAGSGKCLGKDTPVLMYDGSTKKVQDVVNGDILMGDDSTPRTVLSKVVGRGPLKRIIPKTGESWVCNDAHILTLSEYRYNTRSWHLIDVNVCEAEKKYAKTDEGYLTKVYQKRVAIDYPSKEVDVDPYLYGLWLGDDKTLDSVIYTDNSVIIDAIKERIPEDNVYKVSGKRVEIKGKTKNYNYFRRFISRHREAKDKFIGTYYLINSSEVRSSVLAGLIDICGSYHGSNTFTISTKYDNLNNDIVWLCRSIGLYAELNNNIVIIRGNFKNIPFLLNSNKESSKSVIEDVTQTPIRIEDIGGGDYYGFVIDGNHRFLLGDFTVTHNTWTAIKCVELMNEDDKILLTAFNTDIVDELKKKTKGLDRANLDIRTMHSLGLSILLSNYPGQIDQKPNDFKYSGYIYNNIIELSEGYSKTLSQRDFSKYVDNIRTFVDFGRFYLCQTIKDMEFVETHYHVPTFNNEKEVALKVMKWGMENIQTIDFTDMVWLPNVLNCKPYGKIYDWIICDECQDTMTAERMLLLRCTKMSTRMVFFGEKIQCQPEGTKILMSNGTEKNIEDIVAGDEVVTFNTKKLTYCGYKPTLDKNYFFVNQVEAHKDNRFITVETYNGLKTTYTPEHICLAKFDFTKHPKTWCTCLMANDRDMYFLGKAELYSNGIHHGLLKTLRREKCTRGWVLEIFSDEKDAGLSQLVTSQKFNIPLPIGEMFDKKEREEIHREDLCRVYDEIGRNKVMENVIKCLDYYHRSPHFPISDAHNEVAHARTLIHQIRACNLLPEIMVLSYFSENAKSNKVIDAYRSCASTIKEITYDETERMVYSLNVGTNHTYVGDGIATHNCIYSFMGSDYQSFDELRRLPNTKSLPLSISYRCDKNIVRYANRFNERMESGPDAGDGEVKFNCKIEDIQDGDMVLCRVNAPLLQLYCELVNMGKTAYIRGKDVGKNLIKEIKSTNEKKLNKSLKAKGVFSKMYDRLFDDIDTVMRNNHISFEMAMDDVGVSQKYDIIQALEAISGDINDTDELIEKIKTLFSDKKKKGISLSTIHKAKGLEADNVFICCPSLMPSKSAKELWEIQQENNLQYVAYTRAKHKLSFLSEEEFTRYSSNASHKATELDRVKHIIFKLHGSPERCGVVRPSHEAAKSIIENHTEISTVPKNVIEIGNKGNKTNSLIGLKPESRKKVRRRIKI